MAVNDAPAPVHHEAIAAPDGITRAAAAGSEKGTTQQRGGSTAAAERAVTDNAAVAHGILPPKPAFFDSSKEGPGAPDKGFDGIKPGEIRYGKDGTRQIQVDADGTRHKIVDKYDNSGSEEVSHPDGSRERTDYSKGFLETKKFDAQGNLRSDQVNRATTEDGKRNLTAEKTWDAKGNLQQDNNRWQDKQNQWHEDNTMNLPDGTKIHAKMDGDRTETRTTNPDGSWSNVVKTMNVDKINPDTGKHYKTMTVDRTESPK